MKAHKVEAFLENADVARQRGVTPGMVRQDAQAGLLRAAARTMRGVRLYRQEDVDAYIAERRLAKEKRT